MTSRDNIQLTETRHCEWSLQVNDKLHNNTCQITDCFDWSITDLRQNNTASEIKTEQISTLIIITSFMNQQVL